VNAHCANQGQTNANFVICTQVAYSQAYLYYSEVYAPQSVPTNLSDCPLQPTVYITLDQVNDPSNVISHWCSDLGIEGLNATGDNNVSQGSSASNNLIVKGITFIPVVGQYIGKIIGCAKTAGEILRHCKLIR